MVFKILKIIVLILPLSLFSIPGYYEPWGKDADLKFAPPPSQQDVPLSAMAQGMEKRDRRSGVRIDSGLLRRFSGIA